MGITATTYGYFQGADLARAIKRVAGDRIPVVLGGPHVSALPSHAMDCEAFDYGVLGEGEITFLEMVQKMGPGGRSVRCAGHRVPARRRPGLHGSSGPRHRPGHPFPSPPAT